MTVTTAHWPVNERTGSVYKNIKVNLTLKYSMQTYLFSIKKGDSQGYFNNHKFEIRVEKQLLLV